jgi:hypothetical protein
MPMEVSRTSGEGWTRLPEIKTWADYDRDQVAPGAAVVAERDVVSAFDPNQFRGDRVVRWEPRQVVEFLKPFSVGGMALTVALVLFMRRVATGLLPAHAKAGR